MILKKTEKGIIHEHEKYDGLSSKFIGITIDKFGIGYYYEKDIDFIEIILKRNLSIKNSYRYDRSIFIVYPKDDPFIKKLKKFEIQPEKVKKIIENFSE